MNLKAKHQAPAANGAASTDRRGTASVLPPPPSIFTGRFHKALQQLVATAHHASATESLFTLTVDRDDAELTFLGSTTDVETAVRSSLSAFIGRFDEVIRELITCVDRQDAAGSRFKLTAFRDVDADTLTFLLGTTKDDGKGNHESEIYIYRIPPITTEEDVRFFVSRVTRLENVRGPLMKKDELIKHLHLPEYTYAITRPFPWRHFSLLVTIGAAATLAFVATLAHNTEDSQCAKHVFGLGDKWRTNNTAFEYSIETIDNDGDYYNYIAPSQKTSSYGFSYGGSYLDEICYHATRSDSQSVLHKERYLTVTASLYTMTVEGSVGYNLSASDLQITDIPSQVHFYCSTSGYTTSGMVMRYTTRPIEPVYTKLGPDLRGVATVADLVATTLDGLAGDLLLSIANLPQNASVIVSPVTVVGFVSCTTVTSPVDACDQAPAKLVLLQADGVFSNRSQVVAKIDEETSGIQQSYKNYLLALDSANLADIGVWRANSIFASPDMFNATIDPNGRSKYYIPLY
ncbi:hypothetical protein RQP46_010777 [Phenoliferia psychrophenolica]